MTVIISMSVVGLSYIFKEVKLLLPVGINLVSILLFFISILVGRWEGIELGLFSIELFLGSAIALVIVAFIHGIRTYS